MTNRKATEPQRFEAHSDTLKCLACDRDFQFLVTGASDKSARVWDMKKLGAPPFVLESHEDDVRSVAISSKGRWVISASGRTIRIWDMDIDANLERIELLSGRDFTKAERAQYSLPAATHLDD